VWSMTQIDKVPQADEENKTKEEESARLEETGLAVATVVSQALVDDLNYGISILITPERTAHTENTDLAYDVDETDDITQAECSHDDAADPALVTKTFGDIHLVEEGNTDELDVVLAAASKDEASSISALMDDTTTTTTSSSTDSEDFQDAYNAIMSLASTSTGDSAYDDAIRASSPSTRNQTSLLVEEETVEVISI
jgi:hypothetical protein